jgi:hypothetical protein
VKAKIGKDQIMLSKRVVLALLDQGTRANDKCLRRLIPHTCRKLSNCLGKKNLSDLLAAPKILHLG